MINEHTTCQVNDIKQKRILGGNLTQKEKNRFAFVFRFRFCFCFPLSFIFHVLLYFCHSLIFLFFYFNIEDNVVFKVWGYWENFGFLCCMCVCVCVSVWSFWTGLWEYEYYIWELIEIDEDINQMNECACKFLILIGLGSDLKICHVDFIVLYQCKLLGLQHYVLWLCIL